MGSVFLVFGMCESFSSSAVSICFLRFRESCRGLRTPPRLRGILREWGIAFSVVHLVSKFGFSTFALMAMYILLAYISLLV